MATPEAKMVGRVRAQIPRKVPLALVIGIAVIVGIWFGFAHRQEGSLQQANAALAGAQQAETKVQTQLNQARQHPGYLQQLYAAAQRADQLLPSAPSSAFLTTLQQDVNTTHVTNVQFSDTAESGGPSGLNYMPYTASVTGSYAQVLAFMSDVASSSELVTLASVHLSQAGTGASTYTLTMTIDLWSDSQKALLGP